ncbi:MAG: NAD-dependent epimerase/dehydratase family protein [bacterium]
MKVLVTGGAGFIGSHVVEACLTENHEVVVVDNLVRGKRENLPGDIEVYPLDIGVGGQDGLSPAAKLIMEVRPEVVIHLAAQVDVQTSLRRPDLDAMVNVVGLVNVLEGCRQAGVRKIVYASSAAVYGEPLSLPLSEEHPITPTSPYGLSKYIGEKYLALYSHLYGLEYTVLRCANVYGPRQDATGEGGVVAIFADRIRKGESPVIYGDGEQTRDFVYVKDVARANVLALTRGDGAVVNISTGIQVSVNQLLETMKKLTGTAVVPRRVAARAGDIVASCLDNRRAQEMLGWEPRYMLEEGLAELLFGYGA